jgi:hypothetical protein
MSLHDIAVRRQGAESRWGGVRWSRWDRVHGACGALALRARTTRRHDDTTKYNDNKPLSVLRGHPVMPLRYRRRRELAAPPAYGRRQE